MRKLALALTAAVAVCINARAFAAKLPTVEQCHAIAQKRGVGETATNKQGRQGLQSFLIKLLD
jgi:hypothetical protein